MMAVPFVVLPALAAGLFAGLPAVALAVASATATPDEAARRDEGRAERPVDAVDAEPAVVDAPAGNDPRAVTADDRPSTTADAPATAVDTPARIDASPAHIVADPGDVRAPAAATSATTSATTSAPTSTPTSAAQAPEGVQFSGIPALNYIADNGLGLGVIAAAYVHDGVTLPYRTSVTVQIFATTKLVQDHNVTVDALRVLDLPLRLNARVGFLSSLTQNYCGVGGQLSCDPALAEAAARRAGLADDEGDDDDDWDRFVRRYYQRRLIVPYGLANVRYAIVERHPDQPMRVELTAGARASYYASGDPFADDDGDGAPDMTPWPGSLYAAAHPDGEQGLVALVQAGVMFDSRDREPSPTRGAWIEGSARATVPGLSAWSFGGANITARGYDALHLPWQAQGDRSVVLANRLTVDAIVGDAPVQELARLAGSNEVYAFGGVDVGRGIRVQRYLGALKVVEQAELRWRFFEARALEQDFAFTAVAFADVGLVGDRVLAPTNLGINAGGGGGVRVAWNENFVVRLDLASSTVESGALQTYLTVNQPF